MTLTPRDRSTRPGGEACAPFYARLLRLRELQPGSFTCLTLFETGTGLGLLLAFAELVPWWVVPSIPALVATAMKTIDALLVARVGGESLPGDLPLASTVYQSEFARGGPPALVESGPNPCGAHVRHSHGE